MEENEYILLILKHLSKEASPAEQAGLEKWLDADPEHRREYQAIEEIWEESGQAANSMQFDKEAAWRKVGERLATGERRVQEERLVTGERRVMGEPMEPETRVRRFPWKKALAAAAVLLLLGGSGWWYAGRKASGPSRVVLAKDAPLHLSLPDGSVIDLRKGSALTYREPFNIHDRQVELSGDAFFQVTYDPGNPFVIRTAHAILEDLGTSFLVKDGGDLEEVIVASGKVKFTDKSDGSNSLVLLPGRKAVLKGDRFIQSTVTNSNFMSWKTGVLDIRGEWLDQAAEEIGYFYQVPVVIRPDLKDEAGRIGLTARFEHQSLEDAIEEVRLMTGLAIRREKDTLVFSRK